MIELNTPKVLTGTINYGNRGPRGLTGSKIIKTELMGQTEDGSNIYQQVFDDGSTSEFIAPKGNPGKDGLTTSITLNEETIEQVDGNINIGNVIREHQPIKTINGKSIIGKGNIEIATNPTVIWVDFWSISFAELYHYYFIGCEVKMKYTMWTEEPYGLNDGHKEEIIFTLTNVQYSKSSDSNWELEAVYFTGFYNGAAGGPSSGNYQIEVNETGWHLPIKI